MPPPRIMFIRHAEKPDDDGPAGIAPEGMEDKESLTEKGWQRAQALAQFFMGSADLTPGIVFASKVGPHSHSRRPIETVTPLVDALARNGTPARFDTQHLKDELEPLMSDVVSGTAITLVCWEHHKIPILCGLIPGAPAVPQTWPDNRFDLVWVMSYADGAWPFSQVPQMLLAGDSDQPIT